MLFVYDFSIKLYYLLIFLFSFFNRKAKLWIDGRRNIFQKIEPFTVNKPIWFHFASLGEFEQGRPVLEALKGKFPEKKIVISFFSSSGYEVRKNYALADLVVYLPLDTTANAKRFVTLINPEFAVFTKYEYWYHYFNELNKRQIPTFVISAIFRKNQSFFRWYGALNRKMLAFISHIFVQDEQSKLFLSEIGITKVTVSGDTRFDRVYQNAKDIEENDLISCFCGNNKVFIAGSTWPTDEKLIAELAGKMPDWKFIIAPHEIKEEKIKDLIHMLPNGKAIRFSEAEEKRLAQASILIIDNIGLLSALYRYGNISYIGGGFGAGIHNTLEAAAFGMPVLFGPKYKKFPEAKELINRGAGFSITSFDELQVVVSKLQTPEKIEEPGIKAANYVAEKIGATEIILHKISANVY